MKFHLTWKSSKNVSELWQWCNILSSCLTGKTRYLIQIINMQMNRKKNYTRLCRPMWAYSEAVRQIMHNQRQLGYSTFVCLSVCLCSRGGDATSLNAMMPSQRAATLSLSSSPIDHSSNYYDVLHCDDATDELQRSYDSPRTSAASVCCDDEYLTPAPVTSDTWRTATMESYARMTNDGDYQPLGVGDSGKYLQLQGSVYYDYI